MLLELECPHCHEPIKEPIGEVGRAVFMAVTKLRHAAGGDLEPTREALATLAVDLARMLDYTGDSRSIAPMAKELHSLLDDLRVGTDDDTTGRDLSQRWRTPGPGMPTPVGNPPQPEQVHPRPSSSRSSRDPRQTPHAMAEENR